jgi:antitoxin component YwqK of YwqJK toxin-antitoxin module
MAIGQDKVFLDKDYNITNETTAVYYRIQTEDASINLVKEEVFYTDSNILESKGYLNARKGNQKTGTWQWFYKNGNLSYSCTYSRGRIVSNRVSYFTDGSVSRVYQHNKNRENEMPYDYTFLRSTTGDTLIENSNGFYNGDYSGQLKEQIDSLSGEIKNGKAVGKWTGYKDGNILFEEIYANGKFEFGAIQTNGSESVYTEIFKEPTPTTGMKSFNDKLKINVQFYIESMELDHQDYTKPFILLFKVKKDGTIEDLKIIDGYGEGPDEAVLRGLRRTDILWNPATVRSFPVERYLRMPFQLVRY